VYSLFTPYQINSSLLLRTFANANWAECHARIEFIRYPVSPCLFVTAVPGDHRSTCMIQNGTVTGHVKCSSLRLLLHDLYDRQCAHPATHCLIFSLIDGQKNLFLIRYNVLYLCFDRCSSWKYSHTHHSIAQNTKEMSREMQGIMHRYKSPTKPINEDFFAWLKAVSE